MILSNNTDLGKKFNSAVFPGYQGGPLMHVIAEKAVAFGEALKPEFKQYIKQVITNAKVLSETLVKWWPKNCFRWHRYSFNSR